MGRVIVILCALAATAHATVKVFESNRSCVTEGDAIIATDPDTAYRTVTDYQRWMTMFRNVRQAILLHQNGDEAKVRFVHDDGSHDDLHFKNQPQTHTMWFEQLGGDAEVKAVISFSPGPAPGTCRVHTSFYADVKGMKSWFVDDDDITKRRQQQVRDDLTQLQAYFARK
jgi:hypothetical protein